MDSEFTRGLTSVMRLVALVAALVVGSACSSGSDVATQASPLVSASPPSTAAASPTADVVAPRSVPCGEVQTSGKKIKLRRTFLCYEIAGDTAPELVLEMDRLGPSKHWASTSWRVYWSYQYRPTGYSCTVSSASVTVRIKFTFPLWDPQIIVESLVSRWNRFFSALEVHETGHEEIALEGARRIRGRLIGFEAACAHLEQEADGAAQSILDLYRARQISYDQKTSHGATQGVNF